ncbi:MAG: V-type ATPase subunit [Pseudomonadota bacterium]|nr:V-type ATPase subunit [Pseudomonadota bacterium]
MSTAASQAYLNTRVSVMSTRLFEPTLIASLANQSLGEIAERFGLTAILDERPTRRAKSRAIEQALLNTRLAEMTILIRPMVAAERALVLNWGRKHALANLKTLLRGKLYDLDQKEIRDNLYELPPNVRLPRRDDLFRAENVLELLRQLEQGPYSLIARQAREIYEQKREPFALEATIGQRYYAVLATLVRQFYDDSLQSLQQLVGAVLDRANLLWLLRFRFSYQLSPSETFYQLVPSFRLLDRQRLLELVNLETFERVIEALPPPLDGLLAESANQVEVQKRMASYLCGEARHVLRHSRSGTARALAYLILRERDLSLLFALIQGKLLELPTHTVDIAAELAEPGPPTGTMASAA